MAEIERTVYEQMSHSEDKQIHVSTLQHTGIVFVDVREYIPSLEQYGRGITLPMANLEHVIRGLQAVAQEYGQMEES